MPYTDIFIIASLSFFSFYDLQRRLTPGIELFFLATILISAPANPLRALAVIFAVAWYTLRWPNFVVYPLLFSPASWFVLFTGYAARKEITGRADVFAVASLALLFPIDAMFAAFCGLELWRRWWKYRNYDSLVPTIPGFLLGLTIYLLVKLIIPIRFV